MTSTPFGGIVKVQVDSNGLTVLVYDEEYAIYFTLEGEDAKKFIMLRGLKRMSKGHYAYRIDDDGIFILGDQVDDQDW